MMESRYRPTVNTADPTIGNTLYRPVRLMIWPLAIDVSSRPTIIGIICRPDPVGVAPCTCCR